MKAILLLFTLISFSILGFSQKSEHTISSINGEITIYRSNIQVDFYQLKPEDYINLDDVVNGRLEIHTDIDTLELAFNRIIDGENLLSVVFDDKKVANINFYVKKSSYSADKKVYRKPPNMIEISGLFVDKSEVSNIHWMEFLYHVRNNLSRKEYLKLLPLDDSKVFENENFRYYPITNITYEQALAYCKWRTEFVERFNKSDKKFVFRLITPEEWVLIGKVLLEKNYKKLNNYYLKSAEINAGVLKSYGSESFHTSGIYNFFDNVSEMTLRKGVAMGASQEVFISPEESLVKLMNYDYPSPYLGFRCVAEVIED
ncbi:SUMF1/EgtB/PvdO family nonheme iron enzyme [Aureibacter tunicatorum]|uniref:Sulfatase-modifying factor enzyme-like domain-containing protein n=1 Tax=Aureibacter tunicatorum TaxID=866807 RepID=A0AAE3XJD4_9BACT|nr:SUMF1/EgtB/PvdO family nonheme iron enzyme [Aureibacter tunicatorum]MDR6237813.1 hypothetical protein [Aureibacter tunicatorum]BDD02848.1 hypothetical protein AUTU_03310 [Aureibacter tunicatorum]